MRADEGIGPYGAGRMRDVEGIGPYGAGECGMSRASAPTERGVFEERSGVNGAGAAEAKREAKAVFEG